MQHYSDKEPRTDTRLRIWMFYPSLQPIVYLKWKKIDKQGAIGKLTNMNTSTYI